MCIIIPKLSVFGLCQAAVVSEGWKCHHSVCYLPLLLCMFAIAYLYVCRRLCQYLSVYIHTTELRSYVWCTVKFLRWPNAVHGTKWSQGLLAEFSPFTGTAVYISVCHSVLCLCLCCCCCFVGCRLLWCIWHFLYTFMPPLFMTSLIQAVTAFMVVFSRL